MKRPKTTSAGKAVVIGAGIGGLAAAIRLRAKGYDVSVFESRTETGGKATQIRKNGFRFDIGPCLVTLPELTEQLFILHGKNPRDYFNCRRLPVSGKYFYEDGTTVLAYDDEVNFAREMEKQTGESEKSVLSFLKHCARMYDIAAPAILFNPIHPVKKYWSASQWRSRLSSAAWRNMHKTNAKFFEHYASVQFFDRYASRVGSDPFQAPAILNLFTHIELSKGVWLPKGGAGSVAASIEQLAQHTGIHIHTDSPVERIMVEGGKVTGVVVRGREIPASLVVSNADITTTYKKLLQGVKEPRKIKQQARSGSVLTFCWGMNALFPELDVHNVFFSNSFEKEYSAIAAGTVSEDPTVELYITSKLEGSDAPVGCENWNVRVSVGSNKDQNWNDLTDSARRYVQYKLEKMLGIPIERYISCEVVLDPRDIEARTGTPEGAAYGAGFNNPKTPFRYHPNAGAIEGLFFCGGSVYPGGGIPQVLASAKMATDMVPAALR